MRQPIDMQEPNDANGINVMNVQLPLEIPTRETVA